MAGARGTSLEDLQEQVGTFRLRTEPGLTTADLVARIDRDNWSLENQPNVDRGTILGAMLIDLLAIARKEHLDLAFHAKRRFAQMQREYQGANG